MKNRWNGLTRRTRITKVCVLVPPNFVSLPRRPLCVCCTYIAIKTLWTSNSHKIAREEKLGKIKHIHPCNSLLFHPIDSSYVAVHVLTLALQDASVTIDHALNTLGETSSLSLVCECVYSLLALFFLFVQAIHPGEHVPAN